MNEALKVGLLGCGRAAERLHVPALERSEDFDLVAVADLHGARAKAMAGALGSCASFPGAREMLAQTPLDAMIIATPPTRHLADLELGAEAGLPMLVEKPMVVKIDDSDRLSLLGQSVPIMVGYNRRHWAPVMALKEAIGSLWAPTGFGPRAACDGRRSISATRSGDVSAAGPIPCAYPTTINCRGLPPW